MNVCVCECRWCWAHLRPWVTHCGQAWWTRWWRVWECRVCAWCSSRFWPSTPTAPPPASLLTLDTASRYCLSMMVRVCAPACFTCMHVCACMLLNWYGTVKHMCACCWIGMESWNKCVHFAELVWNRETNVCMLLNWFGIVKQMYACCWIGMELWSK